MALGSCLDVFGHLSSPRQFVPDPLLSLVREIAAEAAAQSDPDGCIRFARRGVLQLGVRRAGIWTVDLTDPNLFHGTWGTDWSGQEKDEHHLSLAVDQITGWQRISTGERIVFSRQVNSGDQSAPPLQGADLVDGPPNKAIVALRADGEVLGLLFVDTLPSDDVIDERLGVALTLLSDQIAVALARHRVVTVLQQSNERLRSELIEKQELARVLSESDVSFRLLFLANPQPMWVYDLETLRFLEVNDAAVCHYGYSRDEFLGMTILQIRPEDEIGRILSTIERFPEGFSHRGFWHHSRKDGSVIDVEIASHGLTFAGRRAALVVAFDVTEWRRAESALRESEERFRFIAEATGDALYRRRSNSTSYDYMSPAIIGLTGHTVDEINTGGLVKIIDQVRTPRGAILPTELVDTPVDSGTGIFRYEYFIRTKNGDHRWLADHFQLWRDGSGDVIGSVGILSDITENRQLEEHLRQAQKMEAVGQLAGGIAHDFNNLLTVISGYGEILRLQLPRTSPLRDAVEQILVAGESAASLTRQLLAFSRRQIVAPREVDLNDTVEGLGKMLRRAIGEDVTFTMSLAPNLGTVRADPGQIEQVLMNLASNARDAMPHGGRFVIETSNVEVNDQSAPRYGVTQVGQYVTLSVVDTGEGMDSATASRIFEPFFSTKGVGRGTGLGLAAVYGIVTQNNGAIVVHSEPGHGTTFTISLPRTGGLPAHSPPVPLVAPPAATETILLVEDDSRVRALARAVLEGDGYRLVEAEDGEKAIATAANFPGHIDLLLTDVVMPGMNGRQLAERLQSLDDTLPVIFMSGYTRDVVLRNGVVESAVQFLQKPFSPVSLSGKVRDVLDEANRQRNPGVRIQNQDARVE